MAYGYSALRQKTRPMPGDPMEEDAYGAMDSPLRFADNSTTVDALQQQNAMREAARQAAAIEEQRRAAQPLPAAPPAASPMREPYVSPFGTPPMTDEQYRALPKPGAPRSELEGDQLALNPAAALPWAIRRSLELPQEAEGRTPANPFTFKAREGPYKPIPPMPKSPLSELSLPVLAQAPMPELVGTGAAARAGSALRRGSVRSRMDAAEDAAMGEELPTPATPAPGQPPKPSFFDRLFKPKPKAQPLQLGELGLGIRG